MKKFAYWSMTCLGILLLMLAIPFVRPTVLFLEHRADIDRLITSADPAERDLSPLARSLLLRALHGHTVPYSTRRLLVKFNPESYQGRTMTWIITYYTWGFLTEKTLTEQERLTVIAHLAPTGGGQAGLAATALSRFGHPLGSLTPAETATLIVLVKQPSWYTQPTRLQAASARLLEASPN